jgi:hypothetical protein
MAERARNHTRRTRAEAQAGVPSKGVAHGEKDAPDVGGGLSAFLYVADGDNHEVPLDKALVDGLADSDLLWVDVDSSQTEALAGGHRDPPSRSRVHAGGSDKRAVHP